MSSEVNSSTVVPFLPLAPSAVECNSGESIYRRPSHSPTRLAGRQIDPKTSHPTTGITELVLSHETPNLLALLLPMLSYLSHQARDRWITWIAPAPFNRHLLESYGIDTGKLRLVHTGNTEDILWIVWQALATGNSHTVIAGSEKLNQASITQLEKAAKRGRSQGLLLRFRQFEYCAKG